MRLPIDRARRRILALLLPAALALPAAAQDRADLERTQITGNRELPKVLYIVPWKKPVPLTMGGRPVVSVLDEALAPVDRDVFRRQIRYDAQLRAAASTPSVTAPTVSPAPPAQEKTR
jgi:hypothetical protein